MKAELVATLRRQTGEILARRGLVVAMSGGVDSSVCAALAAEALGPRRVFGLALPERESEEGSLGLAESWARTLGIDFAVETITPLLEAAGAYRRRDEAIRRLIPEFGNDWSCKIVLPRNREGGVLSFYSLVARSAAEGEERRVRLPPVEYREIVAATSFKQRIRKMLEYYHADRLHYAVLGTPNRLEFDQGFFVKGGDGLADVKPIAHLYKSQVYQLAEHLGVPESVIGRPPTTDTYSLPQGQDEFYFALPLRQMDIVLHGLDHGRAAGEVAAELDMPVERVEAAYRDIEQKRRTTRYQHATALLVERVVEEIPIVERRA